FVFLNICYDWPIACPTFVVGISRNRVSGRVGAQNIGNEALIITLYGMVHSPLYSRPPMPIQNILTIAVKVAHYSFPQVIGTFGQALLLFRSVFVKFTNANECLRHECRFDNISASIFLAECVGFTGIAMIPMRPSALKAVYTIQKCQRTTYSLCAFFAGNVLVVYSYQNGH